MKPDFSLKEFKQKTAGMTPAQKADYIWTYYKLPVFLTVFFLIFGISLISAVVKNTLAEPVLSYGVAEQADVYCGEYFDQIASEAFPESKGLHGPERYSVTSPAQKNNPYGTAQLMAYLSAGDLDVIVADRATADFLIEGGVALNVVDISDTPIGKLAANYEVSPLLFVFLSKGEEADRLEKNVERRKAAEHFLEAIRGK